MNKPKKPGLYRWSGHTKDTKGCAFKFEALQTIFFERKNGYWKYHDIRVYSALGIKADTLDELKIKVSQL